jgi:translation initiation factor 1
VGQEICPNCGLPQDLCVCGTLAIEEQRIRIFIEKRKWGKNMTIVEGLDSKDLKLDEFATRLKNFCACGGTAKGGRIELQGDHRRKVRQFLVQAGFKEGFIDLR